MRTSEAEKINNDTLETTRIEIHDDVSDADR
jgi:hypothetical protein